VAPGERLEALTPSRITIVSGQSLRVLLGRPSVAEAILDAFVEALRERQATIRNCAYVRHSERVLEKLLQLARAYGRAVPGGVRIDFPLTDQLLADMGGLGSRDRQSRAFRPCRAPGSSIVGTAVMSSKWPARAVLNLRRWDGARDRDAHCA
jgi:hypothetical protein